MTQNKTFFENLCTANHQKISDITQAVNLGEIYCYYITKLIHFICPLLFTADIFRSRLICFAPF